MRPFPPRICLAIYQPTFSGALFAHTPFALGVGAGAPEGSGGSFCLPYTGRSEVIIKLEGWDLMARGWESKQVEAQIESSREPQHHSRRRQSADEQERQRERQTLLLSRAYIQHQIKSSASSRYTEGLNKALEEIEKKLAGLSEAQ